MAATSTAARISGRRLTRRGGAARSSLSTVAGVVVVGALLFPVYWMVNASLQPSGNTLSGALFPWHADVSGYQKAIVEQGHNLLTSLLVAIGTVIVCLLIATPASYALTQFKFRWNRLGLLVVLVTQMIPAIVIATSAYTAYSTLGILNTVPGLVLADASLGIPFGILVLPMSRNGVVTAGLFAFLYAWGDFLFALTLTTNATVRPITLGIYNYLGTNVSNWSAVMATGVLASIPAIALVVVAQKYIAAGATGGAVK